MGHSLNSSFGDLSIQPSTGSTRNDDTSITSNVTDPEARSEELQATVDDLIKRCKTLHEEVETYISAVDTNQKLAKNQNPVEYRSLRNDFKNELNFLNKIVHANLTEEKARHFVVSSNLSYYEALWDAAKRSTGLISFRKYYFANREDGRRPPKGLSFGKGSGTKGKGAALVDIVAQDGFEWVRVSTISEKRLIFDLAKLGWQNDSDDEDDDEDMSDAQDDDWENDDDEDQVDIVKSARELGRAARANPIRGRPPQVRFVLTRIPAGKAREIDTVLQKMRATGAIVQCANEIPPAPALCDVLPNLLVDRSRSLSDTLNIDCTILLALISDISHRPCPVLDWYPKEVRTQIKEEENEKLLPTHLYPAIGSHAMVCTQEAADQMNLIVNTLATDAEHVRANLLLGQNDQQNSSPSELTQAWAKLSEHAIPEGFQLPIRVVPSNISEIMSRLPPIAEKIGDELSTLNKAIFFYGWAEGLTTLSSNRARARQIEYIINQHGLEDGEAGPHLWLCGESRSLIAKHGRRK
ncbi:hypothetical protein K491DRAFT_766367 [Lophiostoma macrostomum CBS 122681]|uniref:DUF1308 domain-containing protein n=1 Tax=Lophiostoma macrostomum CBS 122681 TaxID=1314788 RepID=A0A6A6TIT9_9PLEO|nr:hypothetical protein K491DRAFT_766367 [Lophiostoma macrostomum CBS 122681]